MYLSQNGERLRLGLPKGRMQVEVERLLAEAGIHIRASDRNYRPQLSVEGIEAKILKPQSIVRMLHLGSRDLGFAGADWVAEHGAELVPLLDTNLDPVELVAAAPVALLENGELPKRKLVVASEYPRLAQAWIERRGLNAVVVQSYGATEVYAPEDADVVLDNTATGATLKANQLQIVDTIMSSSTRLYANPESLERPARKAAIDSIVLLLNSVLEARRRVMLELNVEADRLDDIVQILPCMRQPTVARLHNEEGFAVKVAVPRDDLPMLIPRVREQGGTDLVVTEINQIVP